MNTTTAAQKAGVTTPTVRTWCRMGAVKATKISGRWNINAASLTRRISLGIKETTVTTPWPADHPDAALLDEARAAGVTEQQLFDTIGERTVTSGVRAFSRANERRTRALIDEARTRTANLDTFEHLASCLGHDGKAKRAAAAKLGVGELDKLIRDTRAYARRQKIDIRTPEEKAAARARATGQHPASPAQVSYLADLLDQRRRSGGEGGFANVAPYYKESGAVNIAKLRTLTSAAASAMISSLTQEG